jgi:hypothetical protein
MRKGLAWLAGGLGLAALVRALKGSRHAAAEPPAPPAADPADELRAAIAEVQADDSEGPAAEDEPASLEERRRRVHERAQEAIDAMRDPPPVA